MILPICTFENPILHQPTSEVVKDQTFTVNGQTMDLKELVRSMFETLYATDYAVGLAAPQVGVSSAIFVIKTEIRPGHNFVQTFVNPKLIDKFGVLCTIEEGCLSIPGVHAGIERFNSVLIHYYDENLVKKHQFYHDFQARVIQHEYDHLQGILFTDYLKNGKV